MGERPPDDHPEFPIAHELETPANTVLDKIRTREPITPEDKLALALYMVALSSSPEPLGHDNVPPDRSRLPADVLATMTWNFLTFGGQPAFLTCDNPLFHFSHIDLGKPESEVSFPISSNIVLWGTWRTDLPQGHIPIRHPAVRELNRRTAGNARRYVFHALEEDWIGLLLSKPTLPTNRLRLMVPLA